MIKSICLYCNKSIMASTKRRYCGRDCANKARGQSATKWATYICEQCGTHVTTKPRYVAKYRFCKACRDIRHGKRLQNLLIARGKRQPSITLGCNQCGHPFTILACYAPRQFCSRACAAAYRVNRPAPHKPVETNSFGIGGFREDLGIYFRSRWEANYARYLKHIMQPFEYEPRRFIIELQNGITHSYTPDFLVANHHYVEIKGWLRADRNEAEVLKAAADQLPLPLFVVDASQYKQFEQHYGNIIPMWEYQGDPPPKHSQRSCPTCGQIIRSISPKTKYCSYQCFGSSLRKAKDNRSCLNCGKLMSLSPWEQKRKYCCRQCANVAKRAVVIRSGYHLSEDTKAKISNTKRAKRYAWGIA